MFHTLQQFPPQRLHWQISACCPLSAWHTSGPCRWYFACNQVPTEMRMTTNDVSLPLYTMKWWIKKFQGETQGQSAADDVLWAPEKHNAHYKRWYSVGPWETQCSLQMIISGPLRNTMLATENIQWILRNTMLTTDDIQWILRDIMFTANNSFRCTFYSPSKQTQKYDYKYWYNLQLNFSNI